MNVLIVEDEQKIADFVTSGFEAAGFITHHEADGFRGLNTALVKQFDAIVLDVSLPLMDGYKVLSEIRRHGLNTPIVILTARTELNERLTAFELGADDYLPKPFFVEELIVRLKTLADRKSGHQDKTIEHHGLTLDRFSRLATWGIRSATLTQREFALLECLMLSPGQIFTRQKILKIVWHVDFDPGTNVVDVCIQRLRKKLTETAPHNDTPFPIETIRGVGYRLSKH